MDYPLLALAICLFFHLRPKISLSWTSLSTMAKYHSLSKSWVTQTTCQFREQACHDNWVRHTTKACPFQSSPQHLKIFWDRKDTPPKTPLSAQHWIRKTQLSPPPSFACLSALPCSCAASGLAARPMPAAAPTDHNLFPFLEYGDNLLSKCHFCCGWKNWIVDKNRG